MFVMCVTINTQGYVIFRSLGNRRTDFFPKKKKKKR